MWLHERTKKLLTLIHSKKVATTTTKEFEEFRTRLYKRDTYLMIR